MVRLLESEAAGVSVVSSLLTPACGVSMFGLIVNGVRPSHKLSIILPTLLFRFMPRLGDGDGGPLPRQIPGPRLSEVSLPRLRRLRKDGRLRPAVLERPLLEPSTGWRALAASGPKLTRSRNSLMALMRAFSMATEFLIRHILGHVALSPS